VTASANVMQLVRAHYRGDSAAFANAAMTLARGAKAVAIRDGILDLVREGVSKQRAGNAPRETRQMQPMQVPLRANGMLEELPRTTFSALLLEPSLQMLLDEFVVELEYREELATKGLRARNRLLFWGPPGNGKTSCAAALADALDLPAYAVSLPRLIGSHVGETGKNLGEIFQHLTPNTVVIFDEIDAVASTRGTPDQAASKEFNSNVNTLLTLMDRNRSGVVVATTNRPDVVDPAVLRRFDESIEFPGPSVAQMRSLANKLTDGYGIPMLEDGVLLDCLNYDAVAKVVEREARRIVMKQLLAEEAIETESEDEEPNGSEEEA
jgi:SpoVK/Ycf46/Vps4 family AAA+-type ATPase